jgi:fructose-1,6-bisphosphatase/inositol monophosphatase family enzyme
MAATIAGTRGPDAAFAEFALQAARDAGAAILPHFRAPIDVDDKGGARGYDPVTEADRAAEAVITASRARSTAGSPGRRATRG